MNMNCDSDDNYDDVDAYEIANDDTDMMAPLNINQLLNQTSVSASAHATNATNPERRCFDYAEDDNKTFANAADSHTQETRSVADTVSNAQYTALPSLTSETEATAVDESPGVAVDEDGGTTWSVRRFDPATQLHPDSVVLLLGKRGTGKSVLLKDLMSHMKDKLYAGIAMTPTQDSIDVFEEFLPRSFVYDDFNKDVIDRVLETKRVLSRRNARKRKQLAAAGLSEDKRYIALIMDDCMFEKKNMKNKAVRDVFMNGRHEDLFFVNLQQYVMDMGPDLRSNVDFVFALRDSSMENRAKLWKSFFGIFKNYDDFSDLMDGCTENYEAMVLATRVQSNDWRDCVFWYKARHPIPSFRLGDPKMWYLNYKFGRLPCDADKDHDHLIKGAINCMLKQHGEEEEEQSHENVNDEKKMQEIAEKAREDERRKLMEKQAKDQAKRDLKRKRVRKLGPEPTARKPLTF